ncbi:MAG: class I SAM-dependent methyltransferase [Oscillochloridaceae bacterium umkhey_bin13]
MWLWWLSGGIGTAALLYWQIILAEGAYLGPWAVRLVYGLGARHYDAVHAPGQAAADTILGAHIKTALAYQTQPQVLDVATGTGRIPRLLRQTHPAALIAALDLTPAMIVVARQQWATQENEALMAGAEYARSPLWQIGEAGHLPWATASFDLVTCLEALEYFPRPRQALAELARVTRPGGRLLLSKVPDRWARLLPGRAFDRRTCAHTLETCGWTGLRFWPWQPGHYELVTATRGMRA